MEVSASSSIARTQSSSPIPQARTSLASAGRECRPVAFYDAFRPCRGDLIFGLSTVVQNEERYPSWTPSRVGEEILVALNIAKVQPASHTFVGMTCSLDKNGTRLQEAFANTLEQSKRDTMVVSDEDGYTTLETKATIMAEVALRLSPQILCGDTPGLTRSEYKQQKKFILQNHACDLAARNAVVPPNGATRAREDIGPLLDKLKPFSDTFEQKFVDIFGIASNSFTRNTMDRMLDELKLRPDRSPAYTLMQAAHAITLGNRNVEEEFSKLIFARMSKSVIDAFVSQNENGAMQPNSDLARIHFFLDDIRMDEVVSKTGQGACRISAKELRYLYRIRDRIGDCVKFYLHKSEVNAPWVDNPALWDTYPPSEHYRVELGTEAVLQGPELQGRFVR
jgi:hypothetical protein